MATPTPTKLLTAEEFYEQYAADERDLELVDGRVVEMPPPPGGGHGLYASRIDRALGNFAEARGLGETFVESGYVLRRHPDIVRGPDVSFYSKERIEQSGIPAKYIEGPPDLAVEVVSPNDLDRNVNQKLAEYLDAGTQRVWTVRAEPKTVTVHRPDGTARTYGVDDTLTSDDAGFAVEGFALPVGNIFR